MKANISLDNDVFKLLFEGSPSTATIFQIKHFSFREIDENNNREYSALRSNINIQNLIKYLSDENIDLNKCENTKHILDELIEQKKAQQNRIKHLEDLKENTSEKTLEDFEKSLVFIKRKLEKHQVYSCYHLFNSQSAANFSVPGSGKTSVVLTYYEKLKLENKVNAIFLIGPKNCYYSWKTEFIETLGRDPNLHIFDKKFSDRVDIYKRPVKSEVYACHFQTNVNDLDFIKIFASNNKFLIVIDEAHNIKKVGGKWSTAALELGKMSNYKVVLTGTPMPNQHKDFYNYLDFLYGDNEVMTAHDKARVDVFVEKNNLNEASLILREKLNPFYVRIKKNELNLSKQIFNPPTIVQMNPIEKNIHEAIITKIKNYPVQKYHENIELIKKIRRARILRLRQNCSYVKNLLTAIPTDMRDVKEDLTEGIANLIANYDERETPAKIESLKSLVLPLIKNNKKVLIWSSHLKTMDLIKKHLLLEQLNVELINGKTDLKKRNDIKIEFNNKNSDLDAIVANPQACSESISLHKACNNAIYYDQNYNTAEFIQSMDRIHRVGGSTTEPVYYDFLHYEESVDEQVYRRVFEKADRQMQVIEEENVMFDLNYVEDDIDDLYGSLNL